MRNGHGENDINENGELVSVEALLDLVYNCGCKIMLDTVHGDYWIHRGRRIDAATAKEAIKQAIAARRLKGGIDSVSLIRRYMSK